MSTPEQEKVRQIQEGIKNLRKMELPSTTATVQSIDSIKNSQTMKRLSEDLSDTGKKVYEDERHLLSVSQKLVTEKNAGDDFQKMLFHATRATEMTDKDTLKTFRAGGGDVKKSLSFSYASIVSVVKLLVSSSEFRGSMRQLVNILMELFKLNFGSDEQLKSSSQRFSETGVIGRENMSSSKIGQDVNAAVDGSQSFREAAHTVVDRIGDDVETMVPRSIRDNVRETVQDTRENGVGSVSQKMTEKAKSFKVPEEYKDELMRQLREALQKFQRRPDFQNAIDDFFTGIENLVQDSKKYTTGNVSKGKTAFSAAEGEWQMAVDSAKRFLENLANGKSIDVVITSFRSFVDQVWADQDLFDRMKKWMDFIRRVLRDPSYVQSQDFKTDSHYLTTDLKEVVKDRHRRDAEVVYDSATDFMTAVTEDPTTQELLDSARELWTDLFLDRQGNFVVKKELLHDLVRIMPTLTDKLAYLPMPRFEKSDEKMDIMLDDIVVKCTGIIPKNIEVAMKTSVDLHVPQITGEVSLSISQVQVSANNVAFEIYKKTGFPHISEKGRFDFEVLRDGLSVYLTFVPWANPETSGFQLARCDVHVDKLNLRLYDTKKDWFYKLFSFAIKKVLKKQIETALAQNIRNVLDPYQENSFVSKVERKAKQTMTAAKSKSATMGRNMHKSDSKSGEMHNRDVDDRDVHGNVVGSSSGVPHHEEEELIGKKEEYIREPPARQDGLLPNRMHVDHDRGGKIFDESMDVKGKAIHSGTAEDSNVSMPVAGGTWEHQNQEPQKLSRATRSLQETFTRTG